MTEIVRIHDKWTNEEIITMDMDEFRKECINDSITIYGTKYNVVEIKRIPETGESHNDTFFTYVYVEKP